MHDQHVALGAKLAPFAGWEMPLDYPATGVVKEHTAVRTAVGVFDVSHLGKLFVRGERAKDFVNATFANDLDRIRPGRAQYTLLCDDPTGGVVDDMIVYLFGDDEVLLVPNAANIAEVERRLREAAPAGIRIENVHAELATIAVQGQRSGAVLSEVGLSGEGEFMSFSEREWRGHPIVVCVTGYTGENGVELMVPYDAAPALWDELIAAAAPRGGVPCGLGARDTLRTEMGYPLHGQDLSLDITPVQARLSWAVGWKKPRFWGRTVLLREREEGSHRRLWGIQSGGRAIPRPGMEVRKPDGSPAGVVTTGTFSPTKRVGVGLALLGRELGEGESVVVDIRGREAAMTVVKPPFVKPSTS